MFLARSGFCQAVVLFYYSHADSKRMARATVTTYPKVKAAYKRPMLFQSSWMLIVAQARNAMCQHHKSLSAESKSTFSTCQVSRSYFAPCKPGVFVFFCAFCAVFLYLSIFLMRGHLALGALFVPFYHICVLCLVAMSLLLLGWIFGL